MVSPARSFFNMPDVGNLTIHSEPRISAQNVSAIVESGRLRDSDKSSLKTFVENLSIRMKDNLGEKEFSESMALYHGSGCLFPKLIDYLRFSGPGENPFLPFQEHFEYIDKLISDCENQLPRKLSSGECNYIKVIAVVYFKELYAIARSNNLLTEGVNVYELPKRALQLGGLSESCASSSTALADINTGPSSSDAVINSNFSKEDMLNEKLAPFLSVLRDHTQAIPRLRKFTELEKPYLFIQKFEKDIVKRRNLGVVVIQYGDTKEVFFSLSGTKTDASSFSKIEQPTGVPNEESGVRDIVIHLNSRQDAAEKGMQLFFTGTLGAEPAVSQPMASASTSSQLLTPRNRILSASNPTTPDQPILAKPLVNTKTTPQMLVGNNKSADEANSAFFNQEHDSETRIASLLEAMVSSRSKLRLGPNSEAEVSIYTTRYPCPCCIARMRKVANYAKLGANPISLKLNVFYTRDFSPQGKLLSAESTEPKGST